MDDPLGMRTGRRLLLLLLLTAGLVACGSEPDPPEPAPAGPGRRAGRAQRRAQVRRLPGHRRARGRARRPPPRRRPPRQALHERRRRAALCAAHPPYLPPPACAAHARVRPGARDRRAAAGRALGRAEHGDRDRRRAGRRAPAHPQPLRLRLPRAAPQHALLGAGGLARALAAHDLRQGPGGVPVLPRPRHAARSRWRAGARRTGSPARACARPPAAAGPSCGARSTGCSSSARSAAASSPGSTSSAGAAARRRGSAA